MDFEAIYSNTTESDNKKVIISDDAYAIGEMVQALIKEIERARVSLRE